MSAVPTNAVSTNDPTVLRWYVTVAEMLAFGRAAKALNISRQRLSAAIIDLAESEGAPLFVPGDGPTELTEAGRDLLVRARAVVAEDDRRLAEEAAAAPPVPTLRVGFVPGVTVTKWTRIWAERFPDVVLSVDVVDESEQRRVVVDGLRDVCFVRLPIDREGLNVVPLYSELPVVVVPKDHPVSLYTEVSLADLSAETLQEPGESVETTFEMVAAGVGPVIVPHSIARLYSRRDLIFRTVTDAESTTVALAWPQEGASEHSEEFLGVVRGRSANSSRSAAPAPKAKKKGPTKPLVAPKPRPARRGRKR